MNEKASKKKTKVEWFLTTLAYAFLSLIMAASIKLAFSYLLSSDEAYSVMVDPITKCQYLVGRDSITPRLEKQNKQYYVRGCQDTAESSSLRLHP